MPALPLDEAGKYVAGAYIVFMVLIVIYVAIIASKLRGLEARLRRLDERAEAQERPQSDRAAEKQEI